MQIQPEHTLSVSPSLWQRSASLRPCLRSQIDIRVQTFRGTRWYILQDETAGTFFRFNYSAYEIISLLDGERTLEELLILINQERKENTKVVPDDVLQVLAKLHQIEALRGGVPLSLEEALNRYKRTTNQSVFCLFNPLSFRVPLLDPDRLLNIITPFTRALFCRATFYLWLFFVGLALLMAYVNSAEFLDSLYSKTVTPYEILTLLLLFPVVKALHELGHGLAVKVWGGEVHDAGLMFLIFMPVPYVNATASLAFRNKYRRIIVSAAGIMVELFISAVCIFIWLLTEPGLIHDLAFNAVLIASLSTLLYNGNPLLRFDGYYILEDLVEIPNLAGRSGQYYIYLIQKYLLRIRDLVSPVTAQGERRWFLSYGFISPLYRIILLITICVYLTFQFPVVGVLLACWAAFSLLVKPVLRSIKFMLSDQRLRYCKRPVMFVSITLCFGVFALLLYPAKLVTRSEGIVWLNDNALVHAMASGTVVKVFAEPGSIIKKGDPIVKLDNPELIKTITVQKLRIEALKTEHSLAFEKSRAEGEMVEASILAEKAKLVELEKRASGLNIRSMVSGKMVFKDPHELAGKYIKMGDTLGYVVQDNSPVVRAVLDQDSIGLLRSGVVSVDIVLADRIDTVLPATVSREVPAGSTSLPSAALGVVGGGNVSVDFQDTSGQTAAMRVFQIDLALPQGTPTIGVGGRAYIRLDHGNEPLWRQWSRVFQQLFLGRLPA